MMTGSEPAARSSSGSSHLSQFFNLADHFVDRHLREGRGESIAIRTHHAEFRYAEMQALVNRAGNGLRRLGVQEEQRVLIALPDSPEFAAAYFGAMKIGAVAVPANTALRTGDYAWFLKESRARALIVHADLYEEIEPLLASQLSAQLSAQPRPLSVIVTGSPKPGCRYWDEWLAGASDQLQAAETSADDAAFWLWTSGSTGPPKAAVHLHRDWLVSCRNYAGAVLGISARDVTFSSSRLFHAYGLGNALMFPFWCGATTVLLPERPRPQTVLQAVEHFRPTLFFSVPTLFAMMLEEAERGAYTLAGVRLAVSAAEPLPAEVFRRWKTRFGVEILDGIGSTEVSHIYLSARAGCVKPGSTGTAVPGYELRIVDHDGLEVPRGRRGRPAGLRRRHRAVLLEPPRPLRGPHARPLVLHWR